MYKREMVTGCERANRRLDRKGDGSHWSWQSTRVRSNRGKYVRRKISFSHHLKFCLQHRVSSIAACALALTASISLLRSIAFYWLALSPRFVFFLHSLSPARLLFYPKDVDSGFLRNVSSKPPDSTHRHVRLDSHYVSDYFKTSDSYITANNVC